MPKARLLRKFIICYKIAVRYYYLLHSIAGSYARQLMVYRPYILGNYLAVIVN